MTSFKLLFPIISLLLTILSSSVNSLNLGEVNVLIINNMQAPLTHHCHSQGNDLGTKTIQQGKSFTWTSQIILKKSESYFCDMSAGNLHGNFDIFETKRDFGRCAESNCIWRVNRDGLYLFINNNYALQYHWP
ncbi:unnamed protein product [Ilex paraguariensis]|uniref:S-protein homolog n=1 Tax=Ilex paraguariensis TaxID=185542 RepID=A0ABC8TAT8_9AQUA